MDILINMAKNEIGVNITNNPDRVKQYLSSVGLPPANPWCLYIGVRHNWKIINF
jgi:hypothetical protein